MSLFDYVYEGAAQKHFIMVVQLGDAQASAGGYRSGPHPEGQTREHPDVSEALHHQCGQRIG